MTRLILLGLSLLEWGGRTGLKAGSSCICTLLWQWQWHDSVLISVLGSKGDWHFFLNRNAPGVCANINHSIPLRYTHIQTWWSWLGKQVYCGQAGEVSPSRPRPGCLRAFWSYVGTEYLLKEWSDVPQPLLQRAWTWVSLLQCSLQVLCM